jgi:2-polyprenyl-3-methyl-5-hydroxy-6-metoxy-1,4-benzoquinol methylase
MISLNNLQSRVLAPEVMDDPHLDEKLHDSALRGLARLNWISFSTRLLWAEIWKLRSANGSRPLRVLDVASGAGDTALRLWRRARRRGLPIEIVGVDVSDKAIRYAEERARACGAPLQFRSLDALADPLPTDFDVITSSLFLHHLQHSQAELVLKKMSAAARRLVLIQDLRRTAAGFCMAYTAARVLTRSHVVHTDAVLSVRAAFTLSEVRQLASAAGLSDAKIVPRWPSRFVVAWRKPAPSDLAGDSRP